MSIKVTSAVWDHSSAKGSDLLVLLYIADRCNDDGGGAYPSRTKIAKACRLSERAVQYSIQALIESGELSVDLNAGPKGCNLYAINLLCLGGANVAREQDLRGSKTQQQRGARIAPKPSIEPSPSIATPNVVAIDGSAREKKPKRAHGIPDDFVPDLKAGEKHGFSLERTEREADEFRDYYLRTGKKFIDWPATWRSWLRKAKEMDEERARRSAPRYGVAAKFAASGQKLLTSADLRRMSQGETIHEPERDASVVVDSQFRVAEPPDHRGHGDGVDVGLRGRALPGGR